jgi:hypothetical protein
MEQERSSLPSLCQLYTCILDKLKKTQLRAPFFFRTRIHRCCAPGTLDRYIFVVNIICERTAELFVKQWNMLPRAIALKCARSSNSNLIATTISIKWEMLKERKKHQPTPSTNLLRWLLLYNYSGTHTSTLRLLQSAYYWSDRSCDTFYGISAHYALLIN